MSNLIQDVLSNYLEVKDFMESNYEEINGYDFYCDIFPDNEISGVTYENNYKPNAIFIYHNPESGKDYDRRIMLKDTWESDYIERIEQNPGGAMCSGCAYLGYENTNEKASKCMSLIIELDTMTLKEVQIFFSRIHKPYDTFILPTPTYVVMSGTGLHLYYVFDQPIDLFPNIKKQLKRMKYDLIRRIWIPGETTKEEKIQYQGIVQNYRMPGSINTKYGNKNLEVLAFKTGERISVDYLNQFILDKENRLDLDKRFNSKMSLEAAKSKYPEWYERKILNKGSVKNKVYYDWDIYSKTEFALYRWWLNQADKVSGGHRYYYMLALTIYAVKCNYPKILLKQDMQNIFNKLKTIKHSNELTEKDMNAALKAYSLKLKKYPRDLIATNTGIEIKKNKRNGRPQKVHLIMARGQKKLLKEIGEMNTEGRPRKENEVREWRKNNPEGRKADCIRDLKIDKKTVYKWWDK